MSYDRTNAEHAHIRLDSHEQTHHEIKQVLVELQDSDREIKDWQHEKDDAINKIKNWFIGGVVVYIGHTVGIFEAIEWLLKQ